MIQAQILYRKLQAIGREVGDNLQRISRSPVLSQDRAFAAAIFTNELKIAVQHQYEPEHLFALKESVENLFDYFSLISQMEMCCWSQIHTAAERKGSRSPWRRRYSLKGSSYSSPLSALR